MEFVPEKGKAVHEDCATLVLPALSIGNVGQLAVDLLVSTLRAERTGFLDDPNILPCIGNDAYGPVPSGELALPLEAYGSPSNAVTLVQQRSPVIKGMMIEFAKNLADFAVSSGKKHIVVLSSLDFGKWRSIDTSSGLQTYYLSSSSSDGSDDQCEQFGWKRLPDFNPDQRCWKYLSTLAEGSNAAEGLPAEDDLEEGDYYPSLPFAALFSLFKKETTCPMLFILLKQCSNFWE
ncbi:proteasome assembly chaperone 2 isoform X2 [Rhodamnia argentea]|uniref:Proteasome assembly chaperone 2 n=1 Tax=Rhodamnia argentea TaxID=178133 RepID=A0ABM3GX60_9MYRT|nr:proteasome assembly chaperone 2 isoform X2 [Rhodamnia argentea]